MSKVKSKVKVEVAVDRKKAKKEIKDNLANMRNLKEWAEHCIFVLEFMEEHQDKFLEGIERITEHAIKGQRGDV